MWGKKLIRNNRLEDKNFPIINAKIIGKITKDGETFLVLDSGMKSDCLLNVNEFDGKAIPANGSFLKVSTLKVEGSCLFVSRKRVVRAEILNRLKKNRSIKGKILAKYEDYYDVLVDGQIVGKLKATTDFPIGSEVDLFFFRINRDKVLEFFLSVKNLEVGKVVKCLVKGMNEFFFFVNVIDYNMAGIVHISDLGPDKKDLNGNVVHIWCKVDLKILRIEPKRLSLGTVEHKMEKTVISDATYNVGEEYSVKISEIKKSCLMVETKEGHKGVIKVSEIFSNYSNRKLSDLFKVGEEVKAILIDDKADEGMENRVSLNFSIKKIKEQQIAKFFEEAQVGQVLEGEIIKKTDRYMFVRIADLIDGILHISELSWSIKDSEKLMKELPVKQKVQVMLYQIDKENKRIVLSIKRLTAFSGNNRPKRFVVGNEYECKVVEVRKGGATITVNGAEGFVRDIPYDMTVNVGDVITAKYIYYDRNNKTVCLSMRSEDSNYHRSHHSEKKKTDESSVSFSDFLS